jgi:hypothetical protein
MPVDKVVTEIDEKTQVLERNEEDGSVVRKLYAFRDDVNGNGELKLVASPPLREYGHGDLHVVENVEDSTSTSSSAVSSSAVARRLQPSTQPVYPGVNRDFKQTLVGLINYPLAGQINGGRSRTERA